MLSSTRKKKISRGGQIWDFIREQTKIFFTKQNVLQFLLTKSVFLPRVRFSNKCDVTSVNFQFNEQKVLTLMTAVIIAHENEP